MSRAVELAPLTAGGEYARSNTGTLGTPGNTSGQFTVYNFQVKDYHTYFAAPEADKPFVWVHNAAYRGEPYGGFRSTQAKPADYVGPYNQRFTGDNSALLRKSIKESRKGAPTGSYEAHHIVPSTHTYRSAQRARALLDQYHIDINSAFNGAALSHGLHHGKGLHSHRGMDEVLRRIESAADRGKDWKASRFEVLKELRRIAKQMGDGNFHIQ